MKIHCFIEAHISEALPRARYALKALLMAYLPPKHIIFVSDRSRFRQLLVSGDYLCVYYGVNPELYYEENNCVFLDYSNEAEYFYQQSRKRGKEEISYINRLGKQVPVLFKEKNSATHKEAIGADLPASAFYFLSDWESCIATHNELDIHKRFDFRNSMQFTCGLHDSYLLNTYAAIIWEDITLVAKKAGFRHVPAQSRSFMGNSFAACITHDIDRVRKRYRGTIKRELFDIPVKNALNLTFSQRINRLSNSATDFAIPRDTYEYSIRKMLAFERDAGVKPTVLLKSIVEKHPNDAADYLSYPFVTELLAKVRQSEGEVGLHSSYNAGFDETLFMLELQKLNRLQRSKITAHRHHYLRENAIRLPSMLEKNEIKTDSTKAWANQAGSKTLFSFPYYLYDLHRNRETQVLEIPMFMMEVQLLVSMKMKPVAALELLKKQVDDVRDRGGVLCWNFHHHVYDNTEAEGADFLFEASLGYLQEQSPFFATMTQIYEYF
ncbi:MAG: hypothetical protein LAT67_06520 [Balneolales bacterium]|nr:hypothetical protein [Balneolales bacterium]